MSHLVRVALVTVAVLQPFGPLHAQSADSAGDRWKQYASAAQAGFSADRLDETRQFADSVGSAAVIALYRDRVLAAWGDVDRELRAHSVRKSLLSGLYGIAAERGAIDLEATLADLAIDDVDGLSARERQATVTDLISARSGIYHPSAYASTSQFESLPDRGSHPPGTHWAYNNWDFNVAGVVWERETGRDLYRAFERDIAAPIGMQDYDPSDGFRAFEPTRSRHPAHTFRISARDLARFGQLYLQGGLWDGRQVVPRSWIGRSTRAHTQLGEGRGYGFMWWTYGSGSLSDQYPHLNRHDLYLARGTGGQALFVIPGAEMVVVHRADTDHGRAVDGPAVWTIAERILAAREGEPADDPDLIPLFAAPLDNLLPPYELPEIVEIPERAIDGLLGRYSLPNDSVARIFRWRGEPYLHFPGRGDAELFATSDSTFTLRVISGVEIEVERDSTGTGRSLRMRLGPDTITASRIR